LLDDTDIKVNSGLCKWRAQLVGAYFMPTLLKISKIWENKFQR